MGLIQEYRAHRALRDLGLSFRLTRSLHNDLRRLDIPDHEIIAMANELKSKALEEPELTLEIERWMLTASADAVRAQLAFSEAVGLYPPKVLANLRQRMTNAQIAHDMEGFVREHLTVEDMEKSLRAAGWQPGTPVRGRLTVKDMWMDAWMKPAKAPAEGIGVEMKTDCRLCRHTMSYHQSGRCIVLCDGHECGCEERRGIEE